MTAAVPSAVTVGTELEPQLGGQGAQVGAVGHPEQLGEALVLVLLPAEGAHDGQRAQGLLGCRQDPTLRLQLLVTALLHRPGVVAQAQPEQRAGPRRQQRQQRVEPPHQREHRHQRERRHQQWQDDVEQQHPHAPGVGGHPLDQIGLVTPGVVAEGQRLEVVEHLARQAVAHALADVRLQVGLPHPASPGDQEQHQRGGAQPGQQPGGAQGARQCLHPGRSRGKWARRQRRIDHQLERPGLQQIQAQGAKRQQNDRQQSRSVRLRQAQQLPPAPHAAASGRG
jgi:hypothetical protein